MSYLGAYGYPDVIKLGPLRVTGTRLSYVKPGSSADKCGLHVHDMVVKINRMATPDPNRLNAVMKDFRNVSKVIEFFRHDGKHNEIKTTMINEGKAWSPPANSRYAQPAKQLPQHEMEDYMVLLINGDRSNAHLAPVLKKSSQLNRMARNYADDMAKRDFKGHKDPEGRDPWQRAKLAGIRSHNIRENCAYPSPQPDSIAMVKQGEVELMESADHKVNILYPENVCVGVGIAYRKDGGLMIVQVFSSDDIP